MAEPTRLQGRDVRDATPAAGERRPSYDLLRAGSVAGLFAGGVMLVWAGAGAALAGLPPFRPLALSAATFLGEGAEGPGALLLGALLWAAMSVALTLLFAAFVPRDYPFVSAALLGVGYSFVVLAVMASQVLPRLNPTMRAAMPESGGAWVLAYAAYGVALGVVPMLRRRWSSSGRGRAEAAAPPRGAVRQPA
jgi:hypothetical protein